MRFPLATKYLTHAGRRHQKSARSPVLTVTEAEILTAIDELKALSLVIEGSSSRVPRFEHNTNRMLNLPSESTSLLAALLLRGPQTTAELRLNVARLQPLLTSLQLRCFWKSLRETIRCWW